MIKELNSQIQFVKQEQDFLNSLNDETVIVTLEQTEVCYGAEDSCNITWCEENNIPYVHQDKLSSGGCIVGVSGNLFIDVKRKFLNGGEALSDKFSKALCNYLKEQGLNTVRTDNNDVLVDNFKVASGCESSINNWQYMGYQISINQDINLINNICNKPMVKVPKGLSEFGITTDNIKQFCLQYWSNN